MQGPVGHNWEPYLKRADRKNPSKLSTSAAATDSFAGPMLLSVSEMGAARRPEEATQIPRLHRLFETGALDGAKRSLGELHGRANRAKETQIRGTDPVPERKLEETPTQHTLLSRPFSVQGIHPTWHRGGCAKERCQDHQGGCREGLHVVDQEGCCRGASGGLTNSAWVS